MSIEIQASKFLEVIAPAAITDNAAFTTNEVDTAGFEYATFVVQIGATDIAMTALKIQESDTSGSGFTDVTGADCDGDEDIDGSTAALPSATDDNSIVVIQLDLRKRERYLDLSATAGDGSAGTYASAICILSNAEHSPVTATQMGAETVLRV